MGEYEKGLKYYQKVLEIRKESFPPTYLDLAGIYANIGYVYIIMGEYEKGLKYHQKALKIREEILPPLMRILLEHIII